MLLKLFLNFFAYHAFDFCICKYKIECFPTLFIARFRKFHLTELDKDVRHWELYTNIEAQVRNMMASLRAVSELQNPAIRDRHWRELMAETKVIIPCLRVIT